MHKRPKRKIITENYLISREKHPYFPPNFKKGTPNKPTNVDFKKGRCCSKAS